MKKIKNIVILLLFPLLGFCQMPIDEDEILV